MAARAAPARPALARTALALLPLQIGFRGAEAAWPLLLAAWFGHTPATDLYFLCAAVYVFAGALLAGAFQDSALTPVLLEVRHRDPAQLPRVAGAVLGHTLVGAVIVAVVTGALAAAGFALSCRGPLLPLALTFVPSFSLYLVAVALRGFHVGLLNALGRFAAHPVASGLGMAGTIALIALTRSRLGVAVVPVALLGGELVAVFLLAAMTRRHLKVRLLPSLRRPEPVRRVFSLLGYEVVGNTVTRINPVVDQLMAALSPLAGAGTMLRFAADVASLPNSLLQATLFPALLSRLSLEGAAGRREEFRATLGRSLFGVCTILTVTSALLIAVRAPLFRLLFLHGEMDPDGVRRMVEIAPYALVGVPPFGALLVLARAHVALQNGRIMLPIGIFNAAVNALLDLALYPLLGLGGILLATSLVHTAIAAALWVCLRPLLVSARSSGAPQARAGASPAACSLPR
ncbi:MAG: hypothetical protein A2V77_10305 [Anaeromyxobacter sp. RBG_16_69_14]|nr:MAG: hypothetical protein A2V77_10305 [Anaeromyxobacter sp. RBG_16_69_14]